MIVFPIYKDSHYKDKLAVTLSCLSNGKSYTGKTALLHGITALEARVYLSDASGI